MLTRGRKVVNNGPNVVNLIKEQPLICSDLSVETTLVQVLILIYYINVFNKIAIVHHGYTAVQCTACFLKKLHLLKFSPSPWFLQNRKKYPTCCLQHYKRPRCHGLIQNAFGVHNAIMFNKSFYLSLLYLILASLAPCKACGGSDTGIGSGMQFGLTPYSDHSRCGESDSPEVGSKPTCAITIVRPFPDGKEKTTLVPKSILLDYYTFIWLNLYILFSLSQQQGLGS